MKKPVENIKILIIEDDQEKREELVEILRDNGIRLPNIFTSGYAEKGIDLLEEECPDVVLLDLKIPYNEESISIKIDNSNKVIKAVERINAIRNQEDSSTGIIIISASVDDEGLRKNYKHTIEVVDFFDKDEIALNKKKFITELIKKIHQTTEKEFKHECKVEFAEIRDFKISKLKTIHYGLFERISKDLLQQFEKLNNKNSNVSRIAENVIGVSGRIVEDIINLVDDRQSQLTTNDQSDNLTSVRNRLTNLTGRKYIGFVNYQNKYEIIGNPIFSRKAAEFATFAYKLRSEALHSQEGDNYNNKIFKESRFSIEDAAISITLIIPLINEFINYLENE